MNIPWNTIRRARFNSTYFCIKNQLAMSTQLPYAIFTDTFSKWVYPLGNSIGMNLLSPNYRVSVMTILLSTASLAFIVASWIEMSANNLKRTLWLLGESVSPTQAVIKAFFFILNRKTLIHQIKVLEALYLQNNFFYAKNKHVLTCAMHTQRLIKAYLFLYSSNGCILAFWPVGGYYLTGNVYTILTPSLPGVDISTPMGYAIKEAFDIVITVSLVLWFVYYDAIYAISVFNARVFSGLIHHQIEQRNKMVADKESSKDILRIKLTFRNILKMHGEMIEYVANINNSFSVASFLILMTASASMIVSIYLAVFMGVTQHFFFLACFSGQTFVICALGTIVEMANDEIRNCLNDSNWYLLPRGLIDIHQIFLNKAQHPTTLTAGGLSSMPLNVATFLQIMRKICGYAATLYQIS